MNKVSLKGIIFGILIFLFPFLVSHKLFYGAIAIKVFYIFWITTAVAIVFLYYLYKNKPNITLFNKKSYVLWVLVILFGVYFLSSLIGVNTMQSFFSNMSRGTGLIFLGYSIILSYMISYLFGCKDWKFIGISIITSSTTYSILYNISTYFLDGGRVFSIAPDLLFNNSTFAGTFLLFGIVFTLIGLTENHYRNKSFWLLLISFFIQIFNPVIINHEIWSGAINFSGFAHDPLLILGMAQSSAVVILLVAFYFLIRLFIKFFISIARRAFVFKWFHALLGFVVLVSLSMLFIPGSIIQKKYIENSTAARIIVWESTIKSIKERPILGWGPENFDIAVQKHFDNRLFLKENLSEIWFDRAHNIILDTLIEVGIIGLLVWLLLFLFLIRVFYLAYKREYIPEDRAHLLIILLCANILQLQTSFETVITYFLLFMIVGYAIFLEKEIQNKSDDYSCRAKKFIALAFFILFVIFTPMIITENKRQEDIVQAFSLKNNKLRRDKLVSALSRKADSETLRLLSGAFMKGLLIQLGNNNLTREGIDINKEELVLYEIAYKEYIDYLPYHYRARVNLAYLYLLETILGDPKTMEAEAILQEAYILSPNNPLTYGLDALASLYRGDIKGAEIKAQAGLALNPEIKFSQRVLEHIQEQKKTFPEINFLKLENL